MPEPLRAGKRILLVEDDPDILAMVRETLEQEGFAVDTAEDGWDALILLEEQGPYDLVVLDLMLPRKSGLEVLRTMREEMGLATPVIILTALGEEEDRLRGFELGATDYVVKPFSLRELAYRCRVHTQAPSRLTEQVMDLGRIKIDLRAHRVFVEGREVHLRPKEFALLVALASHPEQVLSRQRIMDLVWGPGAESDSKTVDVTIRTLREKIERDPSHPRHIQTVRGFGYRFSAEG